MFASCDKNDVDAFEPANNNSKFISAVDISNYPEISNYNPVFYDLQGNQNDFLNILQKNGVNTIRLRLWVNPIDEHSGFNEVKQFSHVLKSKGFKTWLTLHYSDTWADPAEQEIPMKWQEISYTSLKDSVYNYTKRVIKEIQPNYIQIGNEINSGLLHPHGNILDDILKFKELLNMGIKAVRDNSNNTEIILHFAGLENSE